MFAFPRKNFAFPRNNFAFPRKQLGVTKVQLNFVCTRYWTTFIAWPRNDCEGTQKLCEGTQNFARERKNFARERKNFARERKTLRGNAKVLRSLAIFAFPRKAIFRLCVATQRLRGLAKYCVPTQKDCEGTQRLRGNAITLRSLANFLRGHAIEKIIFSCHFSTAVRFGSKGP